MNALAWSSRLSLSAKTDLSRIFRYLVTVQHESFGYDLTAANRMAEQRIMRIIDTIDRIERAPGMGTTYRISKYELKHVTLDQTVFWFRQMELEELVSIEGIFLRSQDHFSRMTARLGIENQGEAG